MYKKNDIAINVCYILILVHPPGLLFSNRYDNTKRFSVVGVLSIFHQVFFPKAELVIQSIANIMYI